MLIQAGLLAGTELYGHEMLMSTLCSDVTSHEEIDPVLSDERRPASPCYHGDPHRWPALERGDRVYEMAEEFLELRVT